MDPALISGGAALAGAFLGAITALGGKWIDVRHARKAELRRQTDELLADFWEATDRLFRTSMELSFTIDDIQASRDARQPVDHLNAQRIREIQAKKQALTEATFLLARMRLLKLDVVDSATELRDASVYRRSRDDTAFRERRSAALSAFEAKAAKLVK